MIKKLSAVLVYIIICVAQSAMAQYKISGVLADSVNATSLAYTSVSIMSNSDSVLRDFTRADTEGHFELNVKEQGNYFIRYVHPMFTTFVSDIVVNSTHTVLDTTYMLTLENLLEEFIVRDSRPITIKGDTVEYTADSFKVREFADVDELLRKLPGIEIGSDGKIKAQGQEVKRMLVDGDEFFSDDPAVVSKMLKANMIDKVQVFDNRSEESKITGIEDADKTKTINLTLKENAKQGYMGKVEAGAALPDFYEGQAMLNAYKGKRKIAAYVIGSNTNNQGLGWEDSRNYGSGGNSFMSEDGSFVTTYSNDDNNVGSDGRFGGQGLPRSLNGGLSYNNKFGQDDKVNLSGSYRFNDFRNDARISGRTQYFMPDTQYVNNSESQRISRSLRNNATARVELTIDSTSNINIRVNAGVAQNNNESRNRSDYTTMEGAKINESNTFNKTRQDNYNADIDINYAKKFKKKGRSFTGNFRGGYRQGAGNTDFRSQNQFFQTGNDLNFNQEKRDSSLSLNSALRLTYTEPLINEKLHLTVAASSNYTDNNAVLSTYDRDASGQLSGLNELYSSDVHNSVLTNLGGATLRYNDKVLYATVGGNISFTDYQNTDNLRYVQFQRNFVNFFPQASIRYSKKRTSSISLNYNGATNQPRVDQIQVMVQNTDPLNIRLGNQNLVQEFRHTISTYFNTYKMLSDQYTYGNISYSTVQNAFSEARTIDAEGVNTFQTININGNWDLNGWMGYGFKIKPLDTRVSLNLGGGYANRNSYLNNVLNSSKNLNLNIGMDLHYYQDTGLNVSYNLRPNYNLNETSVNINAKNRFWMTTQDLDLSYRFGSGLEIGTRINWLLRERMDESDRNNNVFLANAYVQKSFLKDRSLVVGIHGNDIFNRNIGFSRGNFSNYITETTYNNIRRYFMLKVAWNFTKTRSVDEEKNTDNSFDLGF